MHRLLLTLPILLLSGLVQAASTTTDSLPLVSAAPVHRLHTQPIMDLQCADGVTLHLTGAAVYVNGHAARLRKYDNAFYEAINPLGTVAISLDRARPDVSFTAAKSRLGGFCH